MHTTDDIKKDGITHVSADYAVKARRQQLAKVNLPANEPVPIKRWRDGLEYGYNLRFLEWLERNKI